jgi:Tol biopolymer transport system component
MTFSPYLRISTLACAMVMVACGDEAVFVESGDGGGIGGGGGGPGVTFEPLMQYGPGQTPGFGAIKISGDAGEIVFVDDADPLGTNPNGEWQLFSFDIGTDVVTQITDGSATAMPSLEDFDLTDNGDSVVWVSADDFVGTNPNNQFNVFIASTSGAGISQVTAIDDGLAYDPQVSGTNVVVFLSDSDLTGDNAARDTHIFSIGTDGTNLTQVTNLPLNPENLALSDNGAKVAFQGLGDPFGSNADNSREIFVVDINGANLTQVSASDGDSLHPKLSDDGSLVAFTSAAAIFAGGNADGNYEMYVGQTDGSTVTQITDNEDNSGTYSNGTPGGFDISGNGAFVVFGARGNLTGDNQFSHTIFWATTDGSTIQQFLRQGTVPNSVYANENFDAENPTIINDGAGIAFESTVNFTSGSVPTYVKIYTTARL